MLDTLDRRLLRLMSHNPERVLSDIAADAGCSLGVASRRIEKLRSAGVLKGRRAEINWQALGYAVEVSLRITLDKTQPRAFDAFTEKARAIPEVLEIQTFLGQVDVRLQVIAKDMPDYQRLYREAILTLPHIMDIEALVHISRVKWERGVPI